MPRAKTEKQYNTFVQGLITEANALTYPENASIDEDNFVLKRDGSRVRRLGIDYEDGYALTNTGFNAATMDTARVSHHLWPYADAQEAISISVVRVSNKLWFFDALQANPSFYPLNNGNAYTVSGLSTGSIETAVVNQKLVIVSEDLTNPLILSYDAATDTVSGESLSIKVRDFWGVDDGLDVDTRPVTLSAEHEYNLLNQGWAETIETKCGAGVSAIDCNFSEKGAYPSNADIWTLGKVADTTSSNFQKFSPTTLYKNSHDNAQAPMGRLIISPFTRGADRASLTGLAGLPVDKEEGCLTTICSYAGRIFYSGIIPSLYDGDERSPLMGGAVFFSKTVANDADIVKCYQEADPTSPEISDIIDTDGGVIVIPEATRIIKIVPTKNSVIIFAENGVWELYGGDIGFKATEYQLFKITNIGTLNKNTIVTADGNIFYWAKSGIYGLTPDSVSGRMAPQNLSVSTIQTYFLDIPPNAKLNARGLFDQSQYKIKWLWSTDENYPRRYNKELVFDLTLKAFYPQTFSSLASNSPYICDYVDLPNYGSQTVTDLVTVNGDQVQVNTDNVNTIYSSFVGRDIDLKYVTVVPGATYSITFGELIDTTFHDWATKDGNGGANFSSYLVTGYELFGDIVRKKEVVYANFYFLRTETGFDGSFNLLHPSGCQVQVQWDWTNSAAGNKWGTAFQAYRLNRLFIPSGVSYDSGQSVVVTKNKLRGFGRTVSLYIYSDEGKDLQILGWTLDVTGNTLG